MGAGGLINWANFPPSFHRPPPHSTGLKFVDPPPTLDPAKLSLMLLKGSKTQFDSLQMCLLIYMKGKVCGIATEIFNDGHPSHQFYDDDF